MRNVSIHNLFRNQTGGFEPKGWQPEPQVRGTWSILSSCLITMLLCVWTAVHLNVPSHSGSISQTARKVGWLVLGLVAPEMIAFTAWNQYREAVQLTRDMREVLGQDPPSSFGQRLKKSLRASVEDTKKFFRALRDLPNQVLQMWRGPRSYLVPSRGRKRVEDMNQSDVEKLIRTCGLDKVPQFKHTESLPPSVEPTYMPSSPALAVKRPAQPIGARHKWTMIHSLYAVMGGFSCSSEGLPINFFRDGAQRATITPRGLRLLAKFQAEAVPDLSVEHIKDKSKADGLKKLIVCLQAGRFLVATIFRMAAGYPIALLELTTVAHCLYALLVYMFWWSKPLEVSEPTLIPARLFPELAALFSMASHGHGNAARELRYVDRGVPEHLIKDAEADHKLGIGEVCKRHSLPEQLAGKGELSANYIILYPGDILFGFQVIRYWPGLHWMLLSHADVERWRLASLAIGKFVDDEGRSCLDYMSMSVNLLTARARNWPSVFMRKWESNRAKDVVGFWGPFILAGLSYGGIHLLAWYAPLRHPVEVELWIISGISISASAPIVPLLLLTIKIFDYVFDRFFSSYKLPRWVDNLYLSFLLGGIYLFLGVCGLLYLFARAFLIVECFISLFYVDVHVFSVPKWTQYVPSLQ